MLGEIYVIAVDPDFQGLGLGNQLTLAGLASIAARGVTVGMLYVDGGNTTAVTMYERLGFTTDRTDRAFTADIAGGTMTDVLPRWDISDLHESLTARSYVDALEGLTADIARLEAAFDEHAVRACEPRAVGADDGTAADAVIAGWNDVSARHQVLNACAYAALTTDSRDEHAVAASARSRPPAPACARCSPAWPPGSTRSTRTSWPVSRRPLASTPARSPGSPRVPPTRCPRPRRACTPSWHRPAPGPGPGCTAP